MEEKNIYEYTLDAIKSGANYSIDLFNRSLKVNKRFLILNGKVTQGYTIEDQSFTLDELENRYIVYQHSVPDERDQSRKQMFLALKYHELDEDDKVFGSNRTECAFKLEYYLLVAIMQNKTNVILEDMAARGMNVYWKSKHIPQLIVLKKWL